MTLRIAFLGSADFSVPSLRACSAHAEVVAVITQPERTGSRGKPAPRPVADAARELGVPVWQPEKVRGREATDEILELGLDALVVAAYGQILPARLLDGPVFGGVNVHASLLPRWRGASPISAAILAGDVETGISIMRMDAGLDTGPIYATRTVPVTARETRTTLTGILAQAGADLLAEVLSHLEAGTATTSAQDDARATYAPRLTRSDAHLDWSQVTAVEVDRRVRALNPWPGVVANLRGQPVRVLSGAIADLPVGTEVGSLVGGDERGILVATALGGYRLDLLQPPGRRPMAAADYLRGRRSWSGR